MLFAFGMPSIGSLIFILVIVLVLFGSHRFRQADNNLTDKIISKSFVPFKGNKNKF